MSKNGFLLVSGDLHDGDPGVTGGAEDAGLLRSGQNGGSVS
jgi:hypothetical protein